MAYSARVIKTLAYRTSARKGAKNELTGNG